MIEYNRKANLFVTGRSTSERHEVLAQARDREDQTREILTLCFGLEGSAGAAEAEAESALVDYAAASLADPMLAEKVGAIDPYLRRALLIELRAIWSGEELSGWSITASGREALREAGLL